MVGFFHFQEDIVPPNPAAINSNHTHGHSPLVPKTPMSVSCRTNIKPKLSSFSRQRVTAVEEQLV